MVLAHKQCCLWWDVIVMLALVLPYQHIPVLLYCRWVAANPCVTRHLSPQITLVRYTGVYGYENPPPRAPSIVLSASPFISILDGRPAGVPDGAPQKCIPT